MTRRVRRSGREPSNVGESRDSPDRRSRDNCRELDDRLVGRYPDNEEDSPRDYSGVGRHRGDGHSGVPRTGRNQGGKNLEGSISLA